MMGKSQSIEIVDSQAHIWKGAITPEIASRIAPFLPAGQAFTAEKLIGEMNAAGVDAAILVPPSFDTNDYVLEVAGDNPERFAVMAGISPVAANARSMLLDCLSHPDCLGVRLNFARERAQLLRTGAAEWVWRECERLEKPVMIFAPDLLEEVTQVALDHPDLRIALDHLALAIHLKSPQLDSPIRDLCGLARFSNVAVKASALPRYSSLEFPFPDLHNYLLQVLDHYGPSRVFWGGDLTTLRCPYSDVVRLFSEGLDFLSESDKRLVMGQGLRDWLHWN